MKTFSIYGPMKSGFAEQANRKYKKIVGKRGNWYLPVNDAAEGDSPYFASHDKKRSDGFGGATLSFELEDGTVDKVQGPWHSNTDSLLEDTGYDATHKHKTQGIIALDCIHNVDNHWGTTGHEEILHYDESPVIGDFYRIDIMAQEFADKLGKEVYYAVKTSGGGSAGWKKPKN